MTSQFSGNGCFHRSRFDVKTRSIQLTFIFDTCIIHAFVSFLLLESQPCLFYGRIKHPGRQASLSYRFGLNRACWNLRVRLVPRIIFLRKCSTFSPPGMGNSLLGHAWSHRYRLTICAQPVQLRRRKYWQSETRKTTMSFTRSMKCEAFGWLVLVLVSMRTAFTESDVF